MRSKVKGLYTNPFIRNVSTLAAGTVISQIIVIGASPLLSRLYRIEDFGNLSVFTSVSIFFAVLSTGRYELSMGLPETGSKALQLYRLIIRIGLIFSVLYGFSLLLLRELFGGQNNFSFLTGKTAYLSPLYIFLIAVYSAQGYWFQRKKKYKLITMASAIQVISTTIVSIIFGKLGMSHGLISGLVIGVLISVLFYLKKDKDLLKIVPSTGIKSVALEYKNFPRYMIFSDLSLAASQQFIPILLAFLYTKNSIGLYAMANRMIRLPNIVITSAIGNVFRNEAIDEVREKGNCKQLFINTFKKLFIMAVPIYALVYVLSPKIFELFLGSKWLEAGYYARILSIMLLFEFITVPLSTVFNIRNKQKKLARFQFINASFACIMLYAGFYLQNDIKWSLILYSGISSIISLIILWYSYKCSLDA